MNLIENYLNICHIEKLSYLIIYLQEIIFVVFLVPSHPMKNEITKTLIVLKDIAILMFV